MKKSSRVSRRGLEPRLRAYSGSTTAALATAGVALGVASTASAQTVIANFTANIADSLVSMPSTAGHATFTFAPAAFGGTKLLLRASNFSGATTVKALNLGVGGDGTGNLGLNAERAFSRGQALTVANRVRGANMFIAGRYSTGYHFSVGELKPGEGHNSRTGYAAFKFYRNGTAYLGWLHLKVTASDGSPATISLLDQNGNGIVGAYGLASSSIHAGDIAAIPEPSTVATGLALFALGAAGVREHRKRKLAAA